MNENCPSLALWLRCFHLVAVDVAAFGHHLNQLSRIIAKLGDSYNYATKTALLNSCQFSVRLCNYVVVILVFERDDTPTVVCNFLKNYIISTVPVRSFEYILHVYSWIARGVSVGLVALFLQCPTNEWWDARHRTISLRQLFIEESHEERRKVKSRRHFDNKDALNSFRFPKSSSTFI